MCFIFQNETVLSNSVNYMKPVVHELRPFKVLLSHKYLSGVMVMAVGNLIRRF